MDKCEDGQFKITGGYESFTERGGFEDIYVSYDSEVLRYFLDGAKLLIEALDISGSESILDVGTGTGHTAIELARSYPGCTIVGVDGSTGMLSQAENKKKDLDNIIFQKHDWNELQSLPGEFDMVVTSFTVSFIEDIERFANSVHSKVKTDGVFAYVNFDSDGYKPYADELFSDLERMSLLRRLPTPLAPANQLLIRTMESKGYQTLKNVNICLEYAVKTAEEWWIIVSRTAIKENFFYHLTEEELKMFKEDHLRNIQQLIDQGSDKYTVKMTLYIGKRTEEKE